MSTSLGRVSSARQRIEQTPVRRLLIIVDDPFQKERLAVEADAAGFDARFARGTSEALTTNRDSWAPDAVLFDQLLPRAERYAAIRDLRAVFRVPLLVAIDDFAVAEPSLDRSVTMVGRSSLVNEARHLKDAGDAAPAEIIVGRLILDAAHGVAVCEGRPIELSPEEAIALRVLMERTGEFVAGRDILAALRHSFRYLDPRIVDVYMVRLMVKLEETQSLRIVRSRDTNGYMLVDIS